VLFPEKRTQLMSPSNKLHIFSVLSVQSLVGASGGEGVIRKHVALFAVFLFVAGVSACGGSNVGNDTGSNNRRDSSSIDIYYGGDSDVSEVEERPDFDPDAKDCNSANDCPEETPFCDPQWKVCVECTGPADCVGRGYCLNGKCQLLNCQPNARSCKEDLDIGPIARVCSPDGQRLEETKCGWDKVCYEGSCLVCSPGSVDCPAINKARFCMFDGSGWNETDCGDLRCFNGQCGSCVPGQRECQGSVVMACTKDGAGFTFQEDCDTENTGRMCHLGMCINLCEFNAKFKTNNGCEYWAADLDQFYQSSDTRYQGHNAPYAIVVSNTNKSFAATVSIYNNDTLLVERKVGPKRLEIFYLGPQNISGSELSYKHFRLTSTLPIVAYQFNPLENVNVFSNDASLLIPTNALGKYYIVMSWPTIGYNKDDQLLASMFTVIATESGDTEVEIVPTAAVAPGIGVPTIAPGQKHTFTLKQGHVLNIEASAVPGDLTGSTIKANKRIAVFGGHVCANVPVAFKACDHLEEQLPPVSSWGKRYVVPKTQKLGSGPDVVRVMAAEDGTTINVLPAGAASIPTLNKGKFAEFEITADIELSSSKPFLVGQYLVGQDRNGTLVGDPSFMVGVSLEQYRNEYVFLVPPKYAQNYVSIVAKTGAQVFLDGAEIPSSSFKKVPSGDYMTTIKAMTAGPHTLTSNERVGLLVYGWDSYVSYGYPGGMNVEILQVYQ
jgi:hypothetical protein